MSSTAAELREEIIRLGPWNQEFELTPEVSTRAWLEAPPQTYPEELGRPPVWAPHELLPQWFRGLYPDGLEGRTVLDCACNAGGTLFVAKELGAGECFGSDVREHWIRQARFLLEHLSTPKEGIRFEVCDLYDLPERGLKPFDVTLFNGIFYHLPDPITGLKIAADHTRELIVVNTATMSNMPDGHLAVAEEPRVQLLSGVYGLNWLPTGPAVLERILKWMGFVETAVRFWEEEREDTPGWGRLEMVASRTPGLVQGIPRKPVVERFFAALNGHAAPDGRNRIEELCATELEVVEGSDASRGSDAVDRLLQESEGRKLEALKLVEVADKVLARVSGDGPHGRPARPRRWVFTVDRGKITRIGIFADRAQALEAAGLSDRI